jgi:hypothetical protein
MAYSKNCALLKEYAVSYFILHAKAVLKSEHSVQLRATTELLTELMAAMTDYYEYPDGKSVSELRKKLAKLGLDVDGSKEALLSRLQTKK